MFSDSFIDAFDVLTLFFREDRKIEKKALLVCLFVL